MRKIKILLVLIIILLISSGCSLSNKTKDIEAQEDRDVIKKVEREYRLEIEEKENETNWMYGLPERVLIDAPHIRQLPELPRGCEVTSLAMLLQFADVNVNKMTLAREVRKDNTPYRVINGEIHFGNPNKGFVGDMYSFKNEGFGVYNEPIFELGERYLPGGLKNISGESFSEVYKSLAKGKPVWVITTSTYDIIGPEQWQKWHTPSGIIYVTMKQHSVLVTGYDEKYIYINDPLKGKNEKIDKESFIISWEQFGFQAITLK